MVCPEGKNTLGIRNQMLNNIENLAQLIMGYVQYIICNVWCMLCACTLYAYILYMYSVNSEVLRVLSGNFA